MPPEDEATTDSVADDATAPSADVLSAKIDELTGTIAERDAVIADLNAQLVAQKLANYDLLMQVPAGEDSEADADGVGDENDDTDIDIDDLFE